MKINYTESFSKMDSFEGLPAETSYFLIKSSRPMSGDKVPSPFRFVFRSGLTPLNIPGFVDACMNASIFFFLFSGK